MAAMFIRPLANINSVLRRRRSSLSFSSTAARPSRRSHESLSRVSPLGDPFSAALGAAGVGTGTDDGDSSGATGAAVGTPAGGCAISATPRREELTAPGAGTATEASAIVEFWVTEGGTTRTLPLKHALCRRSVWMHASARHELAGRPLNGAHKHLGLLGA